MPRRLHLPCAELRRLYESGMGTVVLAQRYHCSPATVARHLRRCGVALRTGRFEGRICDEAVLRRLYLEERRSITQIAAQLNVSASTVGNWRRRLGIPRRGRAP